MEEHDYGVMRGIVWNLAVLMAKGWTSVQLLWQRLMGEIQLSAICGKNGSHDWQLNLLCHIVINDVCFGFSFVANRKTDKREKRWIGRDKKSGSLIEIK